MTNQQIEIILNIIVNFYQGIIVTYFLAKCLGIKGKYDKKMVYIIGTVAIFAYLEIQASITAFEGVGVLLLMVLTGLFSILFLEGTIIRKILYNAIMIIVTVFTATMVGSVVGLIGSTGYIELLYDSSAPKFISMILNQIVLFFVIKFIIKLIRRNSMGFDFGYTLLAILLSVISIVTVVVLQKLIEGRDGKYSLIYACAVVIGIISLLIISLIMYGISERHHAEKLTQELEINAYRSREHDVEQINRNYHEVEKVRHEMNKVFSTINGLLHDGRYNEAEKFIEQFETEEVARLKKVHYTDNIILDYLLNQKVEECKRKGINIKYIINGQVDGVDDIDLHCITSNLLDNAIEATQNLETRNIEFSLFGNEYSMYIEVSNTVKDNVLKNNPKFKTSKTESAGHGYGIKNVKASVEKYEGEIKYREKLEGYLTCQVMLIKKFVP